VGGGVLGEVDGEALRQRDAVLRHRALAEVQEAVEAEDRSAGFVPATVRQPVDHDGPLAGLQVPAHDPAGVAALVADEQSPVVDGDPRGPPGVSSPISSSSPSGVSRSTRAGR
jgi:hypothetical protein